MSYHSAKTAECLCHLFYQCQHALDGLLEGCGLLIDQIPTEFALLDCQIGAGKLLFGA